METIGVLLFEKMGARAPPYLALLSSLLDSWPYYMHAIQAVSCH